MLFSLYVMRWTGRVFYVCKRPQGKPGTPGARCDFFIWGEKYRANAKNAKNGKKRKRVQPPPTHGQSNDSSGRRVKQK